LLSISFELREPAQSGLAASQLLMQRASVANDEDAIFLARAIGASCRLLLGACFHACECMMRCTALARGAA
jgi:hypothetical protein